MKYFAKLILGKQYLVSGVSFQRGVEIEIPEALAKYLEKAVEPTLLSEGNAQVVKKLPRFAIRSEELTAEQKVDKDIEEVSDTLKPRRPGPKPAAD